MTSPGTFYSILQLCTLQHSELWHAMVSREPRPHRIGARGHIADPDARPGQTADLWTQIAGRGSHLRPNLSADSESARKIGPETRPSGSSWPDLEIVLLVKNKHTVPGYPGDAGNTLRFYGQAYLCYLQRPQPAAYLL